MRKPTLSERLNALAEFAREAMCTAFGHDRSTVLAFESRGVWHSFCARCGQPLRRESAKTWREITSDEMARARTNPHLDAEAPSPVNGAKRMDASAADDTASPPGYSAAYLGRKHGLSRKDARELIARVGKDRGRLNAAAAALKGRTLR
jgi:hypothetical protein